MDLFEKAGKMLIGTRMRMLNERLSADAAAIFNLYGTDMEIKWFPVFYMLSQEGELAVTDIAQRIGHSHPSVSKIVREMVKNGMAVETKDPADKRRNLVSLSEKAKEILPQLEKQYVDVTRAVECILDQSKHNLWKATEEFEYLLDQKSMLARVREERRKREMNEVEIIDYTPQYQADFKRLNLEWIEQFFKTEETDLKMLNDPQGYILDNGGFIYVALYDKKPVGVIALIKMKNEEFDFELAKMGVSPAAQGKGIGWLLGQKVIEKAKAEGARNLYLESNTILKPAVNLYRKMGFRKVAGHYTPYERCNIQMVLDLE